MSGACRAARGRCRDGPADGGRGAADGVPRGPGAGNAAGEAPRRAGVGRDVSARG